MYDVCVVLQYNSKKETIEMKMFNQTMKKVWVFSVAAALIAGGGVTMNFMLNSKTFVEPAHRLFNIRQGMYSRKKRPLRRKQKRNTRLSTSPRRIPRISS
jgi:hypothetical protein